MSLCFKSDSNYGAIVYGSSVILGEIPRYLNNMFAKINGSLSVGNTFLKSGVMFDFKDQILEIPRSLDLIYRNNSIAKYNNFVKKQESECIAFIDYLGLSRHDFYDYWRFFRYSCLLITTLAIIGLMIAIRIKGDNRKLIDRRFNGVSAVIFGVVYSVLGLGSRFMGLDFQGIEYLYYISMSLVYFSNFIRYTIHKITQERTVEFYKKVYSLGVVSKTTSIESLKGNQDLLQKTINSNYSLQTMVSIIPRLWVNCLILWILMILWIPGIVIITYDALRKEPYPGFGTSVTVAKFLAPIISVLLSALVIFFWDLLRGSLRSFDPLGYRREFFVAIILCLPIAVVTFVIGICDPLIPAYILTDRLYLLSFHGIFYTLFDVYFMILCSGMSTLIGSQSLITAGNSDRDSISGPGIDIDHKISKKQKIFQWIMINDPKFLEEFCKKTGSFTEYGIYTWLSGIDPDLSVDFEQKIMLFLNIYSKVDSGNELYDYFGKLLADLKVNNQFIETYFNALEYTEKLLSKIVHANGLLDTEEYSELTDLCLNESTIESNDSVDRRRSFGSDIMQFSVGSEC